MHFYAARFAPVYSQVWTSLDDESGRRVRTTSLDSFTFNFCYLQTPDGWSSAGDASACEHIGYMIDGGKLYGLCEIDGVELTSCYNLDSSLTDSADADYESDYTFESTDDCHLDECNMYQMNGEMVYVMSSAYPYVPPCLKGTVADIEGFTPSVRP